MGNNFFKKKTYLGHSLLKGLLYFTIYCRLILTPISFDFPMNIALYYTPAAHTPWKENVNLQTLHFVKAHMPGSWDVRIIECRGFHEDLALKLSRFDVIFNLSYGFGQLGQVDMARWLEGHGFIHTASTANAMELAQDKSLLPHICRLLGFSTPGIVNRPEDLLPGVTYLAKPRCGSCHRNIHLFRGEDFIERSPLTCAPNSLPFDDGSHPLPIAAEADSLPYNDGSHPLPIAAEGDSLPYSNSSHPLPIASGSDSLPYNDGSHPLPIAAEGDSLPYSNSSHPLPIASGSDSLPYNEDNHPLPITGKSDSLPYSNSSRPLPIAADADSLPYNEGNHPLFFEDMVVQPYIFGREFSVAVIPGRGIRPYMALPPVEIAPSKPQSLYIAGQEYGPTHRIFDPEMGADLAEQLQEQALGLHQALGLRGMSRTDFRVDERGVPYVLDVNAMPNFDPHRSLMPALCGHHGVDITGLLQSLVELAVEESSTPSGKESKSRLEPIL